MLPASRGAPRRRCSCLVVSARSQASLWAVASGVGSWLLATGCLLFPGRANGPLDGFNEVAFFAKNQALCRRHREVFAAFGVGFQPRPVRLIRGQAVEADQRPGNVIGALVRQKVAE